jgi:hypothetical protein
MDRQEKKRKKRIHEIKKDMPKYKLHVFWRRYRKNFSVKNLIRIVKDIDYPEIQRSAIREFLSRDNLTFDDFYRAIFLSRNVLGLDHDLENDLWSKCLDLCSPDHLVELIELGERRAADELFSRIDKKTISRAKAKQILIWLFEKTRDEALSKELWRMIESLDPNEEELKYFLDLKKPSRFLRYVEKLLARRATKREDKALVKIKGLIAEIKQGQE